MSLSRQYLAVVDSDDAEHDGQGRQGDDGYPVLHQQPAKAARSRMAGICASKQVRRLSVG